MQSAAIYDYLERFFTASGCTVQPDKRHGKLHVKLTEEMDQLLMNRPFYWHYIQQTGGVAETAALDFHVTDNADQGELIYFGAPRLHQLFDTAKKLGQFIRLYQQIPENTPVALEPWLCVNMKISYQCDLKRDRVCSIGLQLIKGILIVGFEDILDRLILLPKMPSYLYTLNPLITIPSGIKRIHHYIESELIKESNEWADQAGKRWLRDQALLDAFYDQQEEKPESYFQEKQAIKEQYQPQIFVELINAGLFYLRSASFLPD
ncbi:MAG: YqhG family protein [Sporolactobacillus sp.]